MRKMTRLVAFLLAFVMVAAVFAGCDKKDGTGDETTGSSTTPSSSGSDETKGPNGTSNPTGEPATGDPTGSPETELPPIPDVDITEFDPNADYIYKDTMQSIPTNWNPHTYQTSDQSVPLDYTSDSLYAMLYNDELHPVAGLDPYEGFVLVPAMAAGEPTDVTKTVRADHPEFNIPESAEKGYAWSVKLRDGLKWDDGTPITAQTFVDSLERVLRGELLNYRAIDYYQGSYVVRNANLYSLQGQLVNTDNGSTLYPIEEMTKNADGQYIHTTKDFGDSLVFIGVDYPLGWTGGDTLKDYVDAYGDAYFGMEHWDELVALMDEEGLVPLTDDTLALLSSVTTTVEAWGESDADLLNYLVVKEQYPDNYPMSNVGLYVSGDNELTFVFVNPLEGFYLKTYGMSTGFLVNVDKYDKLLVPTETATGTVYSSTYNTNLETACSYGPYKLSAYQTDKSMHFVRNANWYGWTDDNFTYLDPELEERYRLYQTTEIDIQLVPEAATNKLLFFQGKTMSYALQAEDFEQYRQSEFCFATPGQAVFGMVVNGYLERLQEREAESDFDQTKKDLETMTIENFRKALAVSIDRDAFCAEVSPARSAGFGLLGTIYVYDPERGALYRDTDQAKEALCEFYSIDASKYDSLDDAVDAITGFDPETAKTLYTQAFADAIEAGYITDADNDGKSDQTVTMLYSVSEHNDFVVKTLEFLNKSIADCTEGTPFEGKILIEESAPLDDPGWSDELRKGNTDICLCGWQGNTMDPFAFADTWTNDNAYWAAWFDAKKVDFTYNVNGKDVTMKLRDWAECLNGTMKTVDGVDYNFSYGQADVEARLDLLAALEVRVMETYNTLPMIQDGSMTLLSQQVFYVVEDYSPMMGRGGMAYLKYNYDEDEWADFVAENDGTLTY